MIIEQWLLIETLDGPGTWSVLAVGTVPRRWKSLARTVSARLRPIVAAAHDCREPVARDLPRSRHPWSSRHARAIPVLGADGRVYGVRFWVGTGEPPEPPRVASFRLDSRTRRIEVDATALDPTFDPGRTVWIGAETFEHVERFDQALDLVAILLRAEPGSRWLGEITVRTPAGLRTLLLAVRNGIESPHEWRGLLADVTDSVPPLGKSFEATTVDALVNTNPGLYLAVVDTARVRLIRWIGGPIPGLRWSGDTDERTMPHPDDRARILAARTALLKGSPLHTLPALRLATTDGNWLTVDCEASPLPYSPPDAGPPQFALVRCQLRGE